MISERPLAKWFALLSASVVTVALVSGCEGGNDGPSTSAPPATTDLDPSPTNPDKPTDPDGLPSGPPVSTPPPNAEGQTPAFPEQTRASEVTSDIELNVTEVASGLEHPWGMVWLPDGRLLVTERPGRVRIVTQAGAISDPLSGIPDVDTRDQGGLLDINLSPDFEQDRLVYISYAETRDNNETGTTVARGRLAENDQSLENVEVLFRQQPSWDSTLHYGSRLIWDREGRLYVTLGERSNVDARQFAQDPTTHIGTVARINPDGSAPAGNPFANGSGAPEVWSYGHRNIQGADLHPQTGELWIIEHGPRGGDELNKPEAGKNYGWPVITYGIAYSGEPIGEGITKMEGMEQPIYYWDPVIAPAGMLFYEGDMFDEWQGDLIISSLKPGGLVRLVLNDATVVGEERLLTDIGRVRDVIQGPDGGLWIATDEEQGRILRASR